MIVFKAFKKFLSVDITILPNFYEFSLQLYISEKLYNYQYKKKKRKFDQFNDIRIKWKKVTDSFFLFHHFYLAKKTVSK